MFQIVNRKINESEANLLIREIKQTPNIMGYSLREWMTSEYVMVAEDENGEIAGACLNYDFHKNWHKIAALFVLKEFRGLGLGKSLFYNSYNNAVERGKNVYTISANPVVIKMMEDLGFLTFENLHSFPDKYEWKFRLHTMQWVLNLYRIKEICRKRKVYGVEKNFLYGIKIIK